MSKEQPKISQSLTISGNQMSNNQIGQAGRDLIQNHQISQEIFCSIPSSEDVAKLLNQLEALLTTSSLSILEKKDVVRYIDNIRDEAKSEKPDKNIALKNSQKIISAVKKTSETIDAGQNILQKIKPIFEKLAPWLGIAVEMLLMS